MCLILRAEAGYTWTSDNPNAASVVKQIVRQPRPAGAEIVQRGSEFSVLLKPFGAADLSKAMAMALNGNREAAA